MKTPETKVFGIGLSKTGTTSLAAALRRLGYRVNDFPYDRTTREELERGQYRLSILGSYDAITDIPAAPFFAQYDKSFPGSKFVLTIRDHESWLKSVEDHWAFTDRWASERRYPEDFTRMSYFIRTATYGLTQFHPDRYRQVYDAHQAAVMGYFEGRQDDFLVLDVCSGEGYERLCPFLGLPVLDEPFPLSNARGIRDAREAWLDSYSGLMADLNTNLANARTVLLVESQQFDDSPLTDRWNVVTLGDTGTRGECPVDDQDAMARLEESLKQRVDAVVVPWTAFWWAGQYSQLFLKLRQLSEEVVETGYSIIFKLRTRDQSRAASITSSRETWPE